MAPKRRPFACKLTADSNTFECFVCGKVKSDAYLLYEHYRRTHRYTTKDMHNFYVHDAWQRARRVAHTTDFDMTALEAENATPIPGNDTAFYCVGCGKQFSKLTALRHFTSTAGPGHGFEAHLVKQWYVTMDGNCLKNKRPERMQFKEAYDALNVAADDEAQPLPDDGGSDQDVDMCAPHGSGGALPDGGDSSGAPQSSAAPARYEQQLGGASASVVGPEFDHGHGAAPEHQGAPSQIETLIQALAAKVDAAMAPKSIEVVLPSVSIVQVYTEWTGGDVEESVMRSACPISASRTRDIPGTRGETHVATAQPQTHSDPQVAQQKETFTCTARIQSQP